LHFFGAGVLGFAQTFPQINRWTHGTQVTSSHGHFAFFGAYAMLNLTLIIFALPSIKGVNISKDRLGMELKPKAVKK
jgi:nitric oxide reductase subunit B